MRNCHVTREKLPRKLHCSHCPLEDGAFTDALIFYICTSPDGYKSKGGDVRISDNSGVDPVDIARIFDDNLWVAPVAEYLTWGKIRKYQWSRELCEDLREARRSWAKKKLAPPGYILRD